MTDKKLTPGQLAEMFIQANPNIPEHIKSIIKHEGLSATIYQDSLGRETVPTLGFGHKVTDKELKSGKVYGYDISQPLSNDAIYDILIKDYNKHVAQADELLKEKGIKSDSLSDTQRHAINEMVFQLGKNRAGSFNNMWTAVKEKRWEDAAKEAGLNKKGTGPSLWYSQTARDSDGISPRVEYFMERIKQKKIKNNQKELNIRGPQSMDNKKLLTPEQRVALKKKMEEERKKQAVAENDAFMEKYKAEQKAKKDKPLASPKKDDKIDKEALFEGVGKAVGKVAEYEKEKEDALRKSARGKMADAIAGLEVEKDPVANFLKRFRRS